MAAIQTAIELNDQFTSVLYGIMDAVNLATAQMYDMQQAMSMDIDTSSLDGAREAIDEATASLIERCGTAAGACHRSACGKFSTGPAGNAAQCADRAGRDSSALGNGQSGCVYRNRNRSVRAGSTECQ